MTYFNKQGFSDEDIDMYSSIMPEDQSRSFIRMLLKGLKLLILLTLQMMILKSNITGHSELTSYDRQTEIAENFAN